MNLSLGQNYTQYRYIVKFRVLSTYRTQSYICFSYFLIEGGRDVILESCKGARKIDEVRERSETVINHPRRLIYLHVFVKLAKE